MSHLGVLAPVAAFFIVARFDPTPLSHLVPSVLPTEVSAAQNSVRDTTDIRSAARERGKQAAREHESIMKQHGEATRRALDLRARLRRQNAMEGNSPEHKELGLIEEERFALVDVAAKIKQEQGELSFIRDADPRSVPAQAMAASRGSGYAFGLRAIMSDLEFGVRSSALNLEAAKIAKEPSALIAARERWHRIRQQALAAQQRLIAAVDQHMALMGVRSVAEWQKLADERNAAAENFAAVRRRQSEKMIAAAITVFGAAVVLQAASGTRIGRTREEADELRRQTRIGCISPSRYEHPLDLNNLDDIGRCVAG